MPWSPRGRRPASPHPPPPCASLLGRTLLRSWTPRPRYEPPGLADAPKSLQRVGPPDAPAPLQPLSYGMLQRPPALNLPTPDLPGVPHPTPLLRLATSVAQSVVASRAINPLYIPTDPLSLCHLRTIARRVYGIFRQTPSPRHPHPGRTSTAVSAGQRTSPLPWRVRPGHPAMQVVERHPAARPPRSRTRQLPCSSRVRSTRAQGPTPFTHKPVTLLHLVGPTFP